MRKLLAFAAALALLAAALPAWAAVPRHEKSWRVEWHDEAIETRAEYAFGQFHEKTFHAADAYVTFSSPDQRIVVGNAVLVTAGLDRSGAGKRNHYVLAVSAPEGVKMVPVAPTVRIYPLSLRSTPEVSRSGFAYVFRPAASAEEIVLELAAGDPRTSLSAVDVYYAAEFLTPGEHVFTVTVQRNGQVVKRETITVPVAPGRGSWQAKWEFGAFGVSLCAPGARNAQEAQTYLSRGIVAAQVSFQAAGDLRFDPAGTFDLALNGTPVWTRLVADNTAMPTMPTGRAEMATMVSWKSAAKFSYGVGYKGSLLPQVTLHNLPTLPTPGGPGPGSGGFGRYWPALPVAALPIVLGWALGRRAVDVWLAREDEKLYVRRGRRGPRRVRAVLNFAGEDARELVLGRGETRQVEAPAGWRAVEVTTPGRRNRGTPTRLEREADQDV